MWSHHPEPSDLFPLRQQTIRRCALYIAAVALWLMSGCKSPEPAPTATVTASPPSTQEVAPTPTDTPEPVIVNVSLGYPPTTIDPTYAAPAYASSNDLVENLFVGLTWLNPDTGLVEPALAERWERSADGLTWTIYLRDDIFWVRMNAEGGEIEQVRAIIAEDVVYTTRRACRSDTGAPLAESLFVIQGCREVYSVDPSTLDDELMAESMGVRVLNNVAVEFKLVAENSAFPSVLSMPIMRPLPGEIVEAAGGEWTHPSNIVTSGPFVVQPTFPLEEGYTLVANPHWPLERRGNVDVVQVTFDATYELAFAAWEAGDLDVAVIPPDAVGAIPFGDTPSYWLMATPRVTMLAPSYDTPPMDNPGVRQALSLAVDRQSLVNTVLEPAGITGLPASTLVPPGMAGAAPYGEVGVSYDQDAAREALASAGYSGCVGLPPVKVLVDSDDGGLSRILAERLIEMWAAVLGCDGRFTIEERPHLDVLALLHEPPDAIQRQFRGPRPGLIVMTWQADYPDAHHWLADIVACRELFPTAYLNSARACVDADQALMEAAGEHDPDSRLAAYIEIQAAMFGPEGEMPVIPLYLHTRPMAFQPWVEFFPLHAGPLRFDQWSVDPSQQP